MIWTIDSSDEECDYMIMLMFLTQCFYDFKSPLCRHITKDYSKLFKVYDFPGLAC